jgi:hypothetical protein
MQTMRRICQPLLSLVSIFSQLFSQNLLTYTFWTFRNMTNIDSDLMLLNFALMDVKFSTY